MAIISANVQYNRGEHELLDYSSSQLNYSSALAWAQDPYSNAAVGQYIYIREEQTVIEGDENHLNGIAAGTYSKGPYVVDVIGANAIISPLSKSIAGEQDLVDVISNLQTQISELENNISKDYEEKGTAEGLINDLKDEKTGASSNKEVTVTVATEKGNVSEVSVGISESLVTAIESSHKHDNKSILDDITEDEVNKWNAAQENYIKSVGDNLDVDSDGKLTVSIPEVDYPVTGVLNTDNILSVNDKKISSTLSFTKEDIEGVEYLVVKGNNNTIIGKVATSDFTVDGMLDNVEYSTEEGKENVLVFTFNTASGKEEIEIDFSKYVDIYKADDKTLKMENKTFSVKEVGANITKVSEKIPVAGGPLSELLNAYGITEIDSNTDIQTLLFSLFCKELWPEETTFTDGSLNLSIAAPSFTLGNSSTSATSASSNPVEVGTICTLSTITLPEAATTSIKTYPKVSGFTYGYSSSDNNTQESSDTYIEATVNSAAKLQNNSYELHVEYSGFNKESGQVSADSHTGISYDGENLLAPDGSAYVKAVALGPKGTVSFNSIPSYYACSNLGKTRSGVNSGDGVYLKSENVEAKTYTTAKNASSEKSLYVVGKYKYFIGTFNDAAFTDKTYEISEIRNASTSGWMGGTKINTEVTAPTGTKGLFIAIPAGIDDNGDTLKVKQVNTNAYVNEQMVENKRTIELTCGGTHKKNYIIYTWSFPGGTSGNEPFEITSF